MSTHDHSPHRAAEHGGGCCSAGAGQGRGSCCSSEAVLHEGRGARDPICGMEVDMAEPPGGSINLGGTTHYFCSTFCLAKFTATAVAP